MPLQSGWPAAAGESIVLENLQVQSDLTNAAVLLLAGNSSDTVTTNAAGLTFEGNQWSINIVSNNNLAVAANDWCLVQHVGTNSGDTLDKKCILFQVSSTTGKTNILATATTSSNLVNVVTNGDTIYRLAVMATNYPFQGPGGGGAFVGMVYQYPNNKLAGSRVRMPLVVQVNGTTICRLYGLAQYVP